MTDMEKKMMRLGNSNDDLAKKNKVLAGEVERYSEALLSAKGTSLTMKWPVSSVGRALACESKRF